MVNPSKTDDLGEKLNGQSDAAPFIWQAEWIGVRAKSLVNAPGFLGQVIAVLSDIAYLSGGDDEILWLVREGAPRHRRGIPASFPPHSLLAGQGFLQADNCLIIEGGLTINLNWAVEWKPKALEPAEIAPLAQVTDFIRQFIATICPALCDEGPSRIILGLFSLSKGEEIRPFLPWSWQYRMLAPVMDLMKHCLQEGLADIGTRGRDVIGVGPGLTPWGDDFLGGLLFAAWGLQAAYPGEFPGETPATSDLSHWARHRTHPVSQAIMGDLAYGHGPEPLHDLLRLLLKGAGPKEEIGATLYRMLKIGHTTGWFILAGLLTGLLAKAGGANNGPP